MERSAMARVLVLILGLGLVLMLVGTAGARTTRVKAVDGDKWKPVHKYIGKGDTVKWTNVDDTRHDLTAYGGRWSFAADLDPGESAKKRFKKLGTFKYRCVIHSGIVDGKCQGMCGFVHVSKR